MSKDSKKYGIVPGNDPLKKILKKQALKEFFLRNLATIAYVLVQSIAQMITPLPTSTNQDQQRITSKSEQARHGQMAAIDTLFRQVAENDDYTAFEKIFKQTYKSLCGFAFKVVHSHELAEEIVDDVFYNLWRTRKKIHITTSFKFYLITSIRNRSLDCLRKMKKERYSNLENASRLPSTQVTAPEHMAYQELSRKIDLAIESLPKQCRLIFLLSREQELKYKEIAQMLNISIKTVDTQMGRALKYLREAIIPGLH